MTFVLDHNYDAMSRREKWDPVTQDVILRRLDAETGNDYSFSFLTLQEGECLRKIIEVLVPQYPGSAEIKIAEVIDGGLTHDKKGVRYGENLWKGEMYKKGMEEMTKMSVISTDSLEEILLRSGDDFLRRFLHMVLADASAIYFSHPTAWNKIGFPGPAFPEGYAYLGCGEKDTWEPEYIEEKK